MNKDNMKGLIRRAHGCRTYPIGYTFKHKRGNKTLINKTIIDYNVTFNSTGDMILFEYVVEYDFLGRTIQENLLQNSIDSSSKNGWKTCLSDKKVLKNTI